MTFLQPRKQLGLARKQNFSPSFNLPLTNTLVPVKGTGGSTFTRSTTGTVVDFEGVVHTAKINEARFEGARRVENLATYSEDFSNVIWAKNNGSSVTTNSAIAPDGTLTADTLDMSSGYIANSDITFQPGINYIGSIYIKKNQGTGIVFRLQDNDADPRVQVRINTNTQTIAFSGEEVNATYISSKVTSIDDDWDRYEINVIFDNTFDGGFYFSSGTFIGWGAQVERVTGTQTEASEYVSTNVLSAPYHGANVDGVRYFLTDREDP